MGMADFVFPMRVYYEDTDCGGVVYHSNYLNFMERARSEYLIQLGYDRAVLEAEGMAFIVSSVEIDYLYPARLLDRLLVEVTLTKMGRVSLCFEQKITADRDQKKLHARAMIKVGCVNKALKPVPIPALLKERLSRG